jgi:hypothetical protein
MRRADATRPGSDRVGPDGGGVGNRARLYDVTSTYFEGLAESNPLAQRGYSRDQSAGL